MIEPNPTLGTAHAAGERPMFAHGVPAESGAETNRPATQQAVRQWIVENQTLAVLAGFAFGVFVGAMMRK